MRSMVYVLFALASLVPFALVSLIDRRQRRVALICALGAAPVGLADYLFVPEYWSPSHLVGQALSIEGVVFSFGNGGMLWFLAALPVRRRAISAIDSVRLGRRYLLWLAIGFVVFLTIWHRGFAVVDLGVMEAALVSLVVVGTALAVIRPDAWPIMLSGGLGFGAYYAAQLALLSAVAPEFATAWAPTTLAGNTFRGFPIEEVAWAIIYGGVWALATAYGCDVRIRPRGAAGAQR